MDSKLTRISVHAHGTAFADVTAMASFVCRIHLHIKMTISRGLVRMKDTRLAIAFYRKQASEERKMSDSKATVQAIVQALEIPIPEDRVDQLVAAWEQALAETDSIRQTPTPMPTSEAYDAAWSDKK